MTLIKWAIFIVVAVWLVRYGLSKFDPSKLEDSADGRWTELQTQRGSGDETTMTIKSPKGKTRIRWEAKNPWSGNGQFTVRVLRPDGSPVRLLATNVGIPDGGKKMDECYLTDVKEFYLMVNSNVDWKFDVAVLQ